jgi:hypothetical protein
MDKKKPIGYTSEQRKSMKTLIERTQKDTGDYVGSGTVTEVPKKKKKMKRMMDGGMAEGKMGRMRGKVGDKLKELREKRSAMTPERREEVMQKFKSMKEKLGGMFGFSNKGAMREDAMEKFKSMKEKMGGMRGRGTPEERESRMAKRIQSKYDKMSSRFPGYTPELPSPVDTRDELKSYRTGLRDYRQANPGIKPVGPMRPGQMPRPVVPSVPPNTPTMKGGGLARKGVGMAMASGGMVRACGAAKRGKTKGKMV